MTRMILKVLATGVGAAAVMLSGAVLVAGQQPLAAPVFTTQQADAGKIAFMKNCAACHMPDLSGNNEKPPLAGETFMSTWGTRSTKELFDYMSGAMPFGAPSLEPETYLTLAAFILKSNGAVAGQQPYTATTSVTISSVTAPAHATPSAATASAAPAQ
jgi:mono/diheme cytochrome c family protein